MKKLVAAGAVGALVAVLSGCSTQTPLERGIAICESKLQYEIEQAMPRPEIGWLDSDLETRNVVAKMRPGGEELHVYEISGTALVTLSDDSLVVTNWECFTQTTESGTTAAITYVDGTCSTARKELLPEECSTGS